MGTEKNILNPKFWVKTYAEGAAEWIGSFGIPVPVFNTYHAASTEAAGAVLLTRGLASPSYQFP